MDDQTPQPPQRSPDHLRLSEPREAEYDALADIFLGEPALKPAAEIAEPRDLPTTVEASTPDPAAMLDAAHGSTALKPASPPVPAARRIEAVLLGHLPVRASIWVRQYAVSQFHRHSGPVGLLRISASSASLELIGRSEPLDPSPTLAEALTRAKHMTSRLIIRVDETAEPDLTEHELVDEVTILTGADEAAIVASYRLVKALATTRHEDFDEFDDDDSEPGVRVAIMGAGPEQAVAAREKLDRAASAFLGRPIAVESCSQRIDSTPGATLFRGVCDLTLDQILAEFAPARPGPVAPLRLAGSAHIQPRASLTGEPDSPPRVVTRAVDHIEPRSVETASTPQPKQAPAQTLSAPLATLLDGLTALETRCPSSPRVELAADDSGSLHLIAADHTGEPEHAVRQLMATQAWARAHLPILLRCEPRLAIPSPEPDADHAPVLHLLTEQPRAVIPLLEADLAVHLLVGVETAQGTVWVARELN